MTRRSSKRFKKLTNLNDSLDWTLKFDRNYHLRTKKIQFKLIFDPKNGKVFGKIKNIFQKIEEFFF